MWRDCLYFFGGLALGYCLALTLQQNNNLPRVTSEHNSAVISSDARVFDWNDIDSSSSDYVLVRARYFENKEGLCEPVESLVLLTNDFPLEKVRLKKLSTQKLGFDDLQVLLPFQGALCQFACQTVKTDAGLFISNVTQVKFLEGIQVTLEKIISSPAKYHLMVVRVEGYAGKILGKPAIYGSLQSRDSNLIDDAILMEQKTSNPGLVNTSFSHFSEKLLNSDIRVVIDAVYQRPWKDDGEAPAGRFTLVHDLQVVE